MAKIYNEIVIDMNPESSTFEEVLHEDSFEYSGDMMLAQGDGSAGGSMYNIQLPDYTTTGVYGDFDYEAYNELQSTIDFRERLDASTANTRDALQDINYGMKDETMDSLLGKTEAQMLEWIIDNKYGGTLPDHIKREDILGQLRTKLPQESKFTSTDWYGIQDTASKVGSSFASAYSGMGAGVRGAIKGQKDIHKDIYKIKEGHGGEWMSKFRDFLGGLPPAKGQ